MGRAKRRITEYGHETLERTADSPEATSATTARGAAPETRKKMSLMQLTVIVAVNMMGSGIIMLPTNMAQVGAISLLSWIVTAIGSMAIAYGFAQAGVLNQRSGGMAAYAEEAYGRPGYFIVFYLYFISLAIGNVAIAISAVGYLAGFFPGLSATPLATCLSVIALLWLTTVANFGGPRVTGRIGAITVWGVIIPVAGLSLVGWFWFSNATFGAAWNPNGLTLAQGMGSSIALTLWAFLGMESAAQNSDAVENPKRNVPLACMLGTLGAAAIYILSTTVIQGIVPNAELAKSTAPFALAYATMFNPTVGTIIMALAVMACLGSLLGWQFTIAQTGKAAAEERMFPSLFARVTASNAPIYGMVVMAIVQSLMALSTISPTLSQQFGALVNLAVVTNVIPYVIALSALFVMMQNARVAPAAYRRNLIVALVAMLYSTYAIYASGADAVLGGTVVMALGFVIYGFLAPRFRVAVASSAVAWLVLCNVAPAWADTLERVRQEARLRVGYRADARPFSYRDELGTPAGYSIDVCGEIARAIKADLGLANLSVEHVEVGTDDRFAMLADGRIDLLCGAATATLARREQVSFSIPIFLGGVGALVRADSPQRMQSVLSGDEVPYHPLWRGSFNEVLQKRTLSAATGTTAARWLDLKKDELGIEAEVVPVKDYAEGVERVAGRRTDVMFGDRAILLELATRSKSAKDLLVLPRDYTNEPIALGLARGDEELRLIVDRTLSRLYRSGAIREIYAKFFGEADPRAQTFFRFFTLPE
jgi:putrescine:ornithine antiporter